MKQQTAVEWLVNNIWKGEPTLHQKVLIEQAKEMEKEQIMKAAKVILFASTGPGDTAAEQYYNETYGKAE